LLPVCLAAKEVLDEGCDCCRTNRPLLGSSYNQPMIGFGHHHHFHRHASSTLQCFANCGHITSAAKDVLCLPVKGCGEVAHAMAGCCSAMGSAECCKCKCEGGGGDSGGACGAVIGVVGAVCGAVYEALKAVASAAKSLEPVVSLGCHSLAAKVGGSHALGATSGCAVATCCFNSYLQCQTITESEKVHSDGPKDVSTPAIQAYGALPAIMTQTAFVQSNGPDSQAM
jgi:hypothetical protein